MGGLGFWGALLIRHRIVFERESGGQERFHFFTILVIFTCFWKTFSL